MGKYNFDKLKFKQLLDTVVKENKRFIPDSALKELGFTRISSGCERIVFIHPELPDLVVKFTSYTGKDSQNRQEIRNWKKLSKDKKKFYNKPLFWSRNYRWIIYPKADVLHNNLEYHKAEEVYDFFVKNFSCGDIGFGDLHKSNIGLLNNEPVIIDYGL